MAAPPIAERLRRIEPTPRPALTDGADGSEADAVSTAEVHWPSRSIREFSPDGSDLIRCELGVHVGRSNTHADGPPLVGHVGHVVLMGAEEQVIWPHTRIGTTAQINGAIAGRGCHIGRAAIVGPGSVLGDKTSLTDYTITGGTITGARTE